MPNSCLIAAGILRSVYAALSREWICGGPWAIPSDFRHARHASMRFPSVRLQVARWTQEDAAHCACQIAPDAAVAPPRFKGDWVSVQHKFWFRRTPKCAQTSISQLFQQCERVLDLHTNTAVSLAADGNGNVDDFLERIGAPDFKYVALVRDPVDRFCSGYHELWARLASLNISRADLRYCLKLKSDPGKRLVHIEGDLRFQKMKQSRSIDRCTGVDVQDQSLHALAESKFFEWPIDVYAEQTVLAVLDEIDHASWPGRCTSEVRSHARSLNHLFPQAWLIGRASAQAIIGREVYVGSRLGSWPDIVLRTESLENDVAHFFAKIGISSSDCPVRNLQHLNRMATDTSGLDIDRPRLRRTLLTDTVALRFCRIFAIDFLYLGYEASWQKFCASIVNRSLDVKAKGRLMYLGDFSEQRKGRTDGTHQGRRASATQSWQLHWRA